MQEKTVEDYLGAIYRLYEQLDDETEGVRSVDIAHQLQLSKASVSEIVKKLTSQGYLKAEPYSKIYFTAKGKKESIRIVHNHRLIEYFLRTVLKCDPKTIHEEAHKLEHAFSEKTIQKLDDFLKHPKFDTDGHIIPHLQKKRN